jgi:hypothetical protein
MHWGDHMTDAEDIVTFRCSCGNEAAYLKSMCTGIPNCRNCNIPMPEAEPFHRQKMLRKLVNIEPFKSALKPVEDTRFPLYFLCSCGMKFSVGKNEFVKHGIRRVREHAVSNPNHSISQGKDGDKPNNCIHCGDHEGRKTFSESCPRVNELMFRKGDKSATQIMQDTLHNGCLHFYHKGGER